MLSYWLFRVLVTTLHYTPFWICYRLSDAGAWLLQHVVGYRREVVMDNLHRCFPEKSEQELRGIAAASYRNITDLLLESLKGTSFSIDDLRARFILNGTDILNGLSEQGRGHIGVTLHSGNWEWAIMTSHIYLPDHPVHGIYKPLANPRIDAFLKAQRSSFGMVLTSIQHTTEAMNAVARESGTMLWFPTKTRRTPATVIGYHSSDKRRLSCMAWKNTPFG